MELIFRLNWISRCARKMRIKTKLLFKQNPKLLQGDTIVEVLIAIAVAAFAISTSYAISTRSLQRAITARERNESLNIIQNQIADLKIRHSSDLSFSANFGVPSGAFSVGTYRHFCLDDNAASTGDPNWPRFDNNITSDSQLNTLVLGNPGYNAKCQVTSNSSDYFVDIAALITSSSQNANNKTVYRISVRWSEVGSGAISQAGVYYRF
jgi:Tfp pilus assembly protein PilV